MGYKGTELYEGLAALHWAAAGPGGMHRRRDLTRVRRALARFGEPALDVGCGSGRLLIELREHGWDVDGCDLSLEMLNLTKDLALRSRVAVDLYWQAMQELDLPRRYRTILVPSGVFMHLHERGEALEALRRFRAHLLPAGALVLVVYQMSSLPAGPSSEWSLVQRLPHASEESTLVVEKRDHAVDTVEQVLTEQRRYRLRRQDRLLREEVRTGRYRWYGKTELCVMLAWAGFDQIEVAAEEAGGGEMHPRMWVTARRRG